MAGMNPYNDLGVNLGLPQVPRVTDPQVYEELRLIHNAINVLAQSGGAQTGAGSTNSVAVEALEDLPPGSPIWLTGSGTTLQARLADAATPRYARAFVSQSTPILTGTTGSATFFGANGLNSGFTVGTMYYLSNTPGAYTTVAPANKQALGVALTENIIFFLPPSL